MRSEVEIKKKTLEKSGCQNKKLNMEGSEKQFQLSDGQTHINTAWIERGFSKLASLKCFEY